MQNHVREHRCREQSQLDRCVNPIANGLTEWIGLWRGLWCRTEWRPLSCSGSDPTDTRILSVEVGAILSAARFAIGKIANSLLPAARL
jgi:hypothetical protein